MAGTIFSIPAGPAKSRFAVDEFRGVNFTDTPGLVDKTRSPDAPNMIRDVPGKVRKCMGYERMAEYDGRINGYHERRGDAMGLIHAGGKLYKGDAALYDGMADARSRSWQMGDKLYIQDGKALLVYDGTRVKKASEGAYIPTLTIAKSPAGGGKEYEALNLLQPAFRELFAADGTAKSYQLSFGGLDSTAVKCWLLVGEGNWQEKKEGTEFSVNRATGTVTFTQAPGKSPITGEDNVKIEACRTVQGYAERINRCTLGILFGVNGNADRLFVSGNPDGAYINYDWYSGQNDPTYWPDTAYATVGAANSAVMGYTVINNYLAAIKDDREPERNIVIRQGNLVDNEPAFPVYNTLQGPGAVAPWSSAYLKTEPLFLTNLGVYAVTTSDISGEKYSQNRSYYLDGKLRTEPGLQNAFGFVYNDLYWLCINGSAYILDGMQPLNTDRSAPYSTRQYAGFYRTNLPARVMWEKDGRLWFGSENGRVYRFYADTAAPGSYNDDGEAIDAYWTTGYIYGSEFERNKIFRRISVLVDSLPVSSVELQARRKGAWETVFRESAGTRYRSWMHTAWSKWTWRTDETPKTLTRKAKIKKADKAQYRFRNAELNEPFGILQYACEYTTGSYHKG